MNNTKLLKEVAVATEAALNERAVSGDNSRKAKVGGVDTGRLTSFVERIEKLKEEQASIGDDIRDVKTEAKSAGYDVATINEMLKLRAMDKADRDEREALRDTYALALGVFG